ncbi:MAG TPA: Rrf2 family transcriptional regulator [Bacteroidales bacterium]|nr:Rrf2 family transcriptional regulator [Bacteroidales bacterium]
MKFNTKTRYGVRTMLEIAINASPKGIFQKDIAKNQNISVRYLDHIIAALKAKGLIISVRGHKSGYTLTRKPCDITLYDIHNAFEPGINIVDCLSESKECEKENSCASRFFWDELNTLIVNYLESKTLQDLLDQHNAVVV